MRTRWRTFCLGWALPHSAALVFVGVAPVRAEPRGRGVLILRSSAGPAEESLHRKVDEALADALVASGFKSASASPIPLEEVELAAGCTLSKPECLHSVSAPVDAEWMLIRTLVREPSGAYQLGLVVQNRADETLLRRALATLTVAEQGAPAKLVSNLVGLLFPPKADAQPATSPPKPAANPPASQDSPNSGGSRALRILGWSNVAASAGLLASGAVLGVMSRHDLHTYEHLTIQGPADAERAASLFDRAQRRAQVANGLLIGAASVAAVGAGLLVWDLVKARRAKPRIEVAVAPEPAGAVLMLSGKLEGRSRR